MVENHESKEYSGDEVVVRSLRPFGTSIFTEMTVLSDKHGAINLSQGFPDFDGPEEIRRRAAEAIIRGPNQYAPSIGVPLLRQAIARKMRRFYGLEIDPDEEVTVTSGATEGICATMLAILEPGDEVILFQPTYDVYPPLVSLARARARYVPLQGASFKVPRDELAKAFGPRTKAIVINSPLNPCGKVFTRDELSFIGSLCREHDVLAVGDEVYEHIVFDSREHVPLLAVPELRDRAFVVSSTAKTFSLTGWKQGYVIAPPALTGAVRMSHQFITFCGQSFLQEAVAFAIDLPDSYYDNLLADYTRKRSWICEELERLGFKVTPPEGTYYVLVDITPLGHDDDLAFCRMLPEEAGVAAIPCSFFWEGRSMGRKLVRFCFCKRDDTLEEAMRRLRQWNARK
ncbi:MAG: aminotransferase class I/II-fold pyridoxal phosphate-dependent enzyme [Deltaproteobacteria bacterium]|nr:aminotransferase class I/II-fold pyridoxal phosphate-dependent enzyme [Deltaproteobacteria bacterium]MBW2137968.1 aminotransferase class I/II-fold pyridoxal phosphate-dependent enzyme [Deltaproteobacteria bacterium]